MKLPDTPSELITVALDDLETCRREGININMGLWTRGYRKEECTVCLAGAVMVQTLDCFGQNDYVYEGFGHPDYYEDDSTGLKLHALNDFRRGDILSGMNLMGIDYNNEDVVKKLRMRTPKRGETRPPWLPMTDYHEDAEQFVKEMRQLVKKLKEINL